MRKILKKLSIAVLTLCCFSLIGIGAGCGKKDSEETVEPEKIELVLSNEVLTLDVYSVGTLSVESGATDTQTWESLSPEIATVDQNGVVTALSEGRCEIRLTNENGSASCFVIVTNSYVAPVLKLENTNVVLTKGDGYVIAPAVWYKGEDCTSKATISYNVSGDADESVAQLTAEGNVATVTANEFGVTEYVVYTEYAGVQLSQTIKITVKELGLVFDPVNLTPSVGGFVKELSTLHEGNFKPLVKVVNGDTVTEDAEITYVSNDEDVIKITSEGTFEIGNNGTAEVVGSYNGNTFTVIVSVVKPAMQISLANDDPVEVGDLEDIEFAQTLTGHFVEAKIDGVSVGEDIVDGKLRLSAEKLNRLPVSSYGKDILLTFETNKISYSVAIDLYTLVINNESEYMRIGTLSKAVYPDQPMLFGGYFLLGNHIKIKGEMVEFIDRDGTEKSIKGDGTEGFCGVIDGNGYTLDGLSRTGSAGNAFVTTMHADGVIKNIGFTNVKYGATGGSFLVQSGSGTIENVYIHYAEISKSGAWSGTVMNPTVSVNRVIIDASQTVISDEGKAFSLFAVTKSNVKVIDDNYIAILPEDYDAKTDVKLDGTEDLSSYTDKRIFYGVEAFGKSEKAEEVAQWDVSLWRVNFETGELTFGHEVVKAEIPEDAVYETINVEATPTRVELDVRNDGVCREDVVDLGLEEYIGEGYILLSVNGNEVNGTQITKSMFGYAYGNTTVSIRALKDKTVYTVNIPVLLVTKVIKSVEDYEAWGTLSKLCDYGGYFELGADLSQEGGIAINAWNTVDNIAWSSTVSGYAVDETKGFKGVFDGCGYVIDGITSDKTSQLETFMGSMTSTGVLRNIGFTNVSLTGASGNVFLTRSLAGTISNVYVQYKAIPELAHSAATTARSMTIMGFYAPTNALKLENVFVDASAITLSDKSQYGFGTLGDEAIAGEGIYGITATNADNLAWAELNTWSHKGQAFKSYADFKASAAFTTVSAWTEACAYWHIDETTGTVTFGRNK